MVPQRGIYYSIVQGPLLWDHVIALIMFNQRSSNWKKFLVSSFLYYLKKAESRNVIKLSRTGKTCKGEIGYQHMSISDLILPTQPIKS